MTTRDSGRGKEPEKKTGSEKEDALSADVERSAAASAEEFDEETQKEIAEAIKGLDPASREARIAKAKIIARKRREAKERQRAQASSKPEGEAAARGEGEGASESASEGDDEEGFALTDEILREIEGALSGRDPEAPSSKIIRAKIIEKHKKAYREEKSKLAEAIAKGEVEVDMSKLDPESREYKILAAKKRAAERRGAQGKAGAVAGASAGQARSERAKMKEKEGEVKNLYASSKRIHPKYVMGLYSKLRLLAVFATQFVFFILPWFNMDGRQAVLFDIKSRLFYIFGLVLFPSDLIFLSGLLFICAFGLFWWTTVAGRLWCGYACPQTVYTEIMMWFDYFFEGDRAKRLKLEKSPWTGEKILRKLAKYATIVLFCAWVGLTFVGWFTPIRGVFKDLVTFNLTGTEIFAASFYGVFTWLLAHIMREQVCKYMCPYARFQSAMVDKDTWVISYDAARGEPRGARRKGRDNGLGDCVNCTMCVQVCPAGIDIRDGYQYECIGCAACVDACDEIMDKVGKPRGLIRYTTEAALDGEYKDRDIWKKMFRPRALGYFIVLSTVVGVWATGLVLRPEVRGELVKDHGVLYRDNMAGWVENSYTLRYVNASEKDMLVRPSVNGLAEIKLTGMPEKVVVPAGETIITPVQVSVPPSSLTKEGSGAKSYNIALEVDYAPVPKDEHGKHRAHVGKDGERHVDESKLGKHRVHRSKAVFIGE